jgi:DNA-binding NarL/FixJ family response regulator
MAGEATTVLVVEDEAVVAHILANGVAAARGFGVVGRTCSGADALRQMVSHDAIDLVLLDTSSCRTCRAWTCFGGCGPRGATST